MKKILIIGGGFAGLSCLRQLSGKGLHLALVDKKKTCDFLPGVPDMIGRGVRPVSLALRLEQLCRRFGCEFINAEVTSFDIGSRQAIAGSGIRFDYAVIASGAETNFYGHEDARRYAYPLYNVQEGKRLRLRLASKPCRTYVVAGGGYTGVEAATEIQRFASRRDLKIKVMIVEKTGDLLGSLPEWMRGYAFRNLETLGIEVRLGTTITDVRDRRLRLSGGEWLEDAELVWAAGVKTAPFIAGMGVAKDRQGRIVVDKRLVFAPGCLAAGDACHFSHDNLSLRMAVQFAISQGAAAGRNILRDARGKPMAAYRPFDAGFIIPMANNRSCGLLFSRLPVKGVVPTVLHYCMCLYRSWGMKTRFNLARDLLNPS